MRTLYQFPISHFCEKTRWHLDAKKLRYEVKNLLPGVHALVARRATGKRTVPVLLDDGTAIGDSSAIALHLERAYPERALLPAEGASRARVLELEGFFDESFGKAVRRWIYGKALEHRGVVREAFFHGYPRHVRALGGLMGGVVERGIRKMYRIDADSIAKSHGVLVDAIDKLERAIEGDPSRYLVGDTLSLADITAASLLGPLAAPERSPWHGFEFPGEVADARDALRARPAGRWVLERYARDRAAPA